MSCGCAPARRSSRRGNRRGCDQLSDRCLRSPRAPAYCSARRSRSRRSPRRRRVSPADATSTLVRLVQVSRAFPACREAPMEPARRSEFTALARRRLGGLGCRGAPRSAAALLGREPRLAERSRRLAPSAPPPVATGRRRRPRRLRPTASHPSAVADAPSEARDGEFRPAKISTASPSFCRRRSPSIRRPPFRRALEASFSSAFSSRRRRAVARRGRAGRAGGSRSAAVAAVRQWRFEPGAEGRRGRRGLDDASPFPSTCRGKPSRPAAGGPRGAEGARERGRDDRDRETEVDQAVEGEREESAESAEASALSSR